MRCARQKAKAEAEKAAAEGAVKAAAGTAAAELRRRRSVERYEARCDQIVMDNPELLEALHDFKSLSTGRQNSLTCVESATSKLLYHRRFLSLAR